MSDYARWQYRKPGSLNVQEKEVADNKSQYQTSWHYQSFMLRLWREGASSPYRASLQATTNGEQIIFADLPDLFAFLSRLDRPTQNQNDDDVIRPTGII